MACLQFERQRRAYKAEKEVELPVHIRTGTYGCNMLTHRVVEPARNPMLAQKENFATKGKWSDASNAALESSMSQVTRWRVSAALA